MHKLRKIQVSTGIFWIEVPEADLRVLCGCPADSVKHLSKRGLIVTQEQNGVTSQTGPNAILISDVAVQSGSFANMGEFPVLQMLYFQGMIIPNHPNNTGQKPLIMGLAEQVDAQMNYIHRGNYGLISEAEMIDAGISAVEARELMRMKLKFAFGGIRHARELLDYRVVGPEPVEVQGGVTVRRLEVNRFRFDYQGEFAEVDLNLGLDDEYESPYPLSFHRIRRGYFDVLHSGDGDGWDVNRPSMASILMFQGRIYLIDAGPNIAASLRALGIGINEIEGIFHTHSHDDHFAGITSLIRAGHRIKYFSTPLVRAAVTKKITALLAIEETSFADFFDVRDLEPDTWNTIDGLEVRPILSPHPVENIIILFRALGEEGERSYGHFADLVSLQTLDGMVTEDADAPGVSRDFYERVRADYLTPATLKKLDAGGGLIHGNPTDFCEDKTAKIVLAHLARPLTTAEKEIGSGAPFGTVDVLIEPYQEYDRRHAFQYLRSYFPTVPADQIQVLMNTCIVEFNPETIIQHEGEIPEHLHLVVAGAVEMVRSRGNVHGELSGGAFLGAAAALRNKPGDRTYRAASFVKALQIPAKLFVRFIENTGLLDEWERQHEKRTFIQNSCLFGTNVALPAQNRIATAMESERLEAGEVLNLENNKALRLIKAGHVQRLIGDEVLETLEPGDFFAEEEAVFGLPSVFSFLAQTDTDLYRLPGKVVADIPVVRWELLEALERRRRLALSTDQHGLPVFEWRPEYSIQVQKMDFQHKKLFDLAGGVLNILTQGRGRDVLITALDSLIVSTREHFSAEVALLDSYAYPEIKAHRRHHARLLEQISVLRETMTEGKSISDADFRIYFEDWLINHILAEDRKYATYLNAEGCF